MEEQRVHAHFGWRFLAWFIDYFVISMITSVVLLVVMVLFAGTLDWATLMDEQALEQMSEDEAMALFIPMFIGIFVAIIACLIAYFLYYAFMESSSTQATVGKLVCGLKVTDYEGNRISFMRALGKALGSYISQMIMYIGYLMPIFTDKKQTLHDIMAGVVVWRVIPPASHHGQAQQ